MEIGGSGSRVGVSGVGGSVALVGESKNNCGYETFRVWTSGRNFEWFGNSYI